MFSLLLLPLGTVQPLLSHLLSLLEHLNDFNSLLPETVLLEEQELGIQAQKTCSGQFSDPQIYSGFFLFFFFIIGPCIIAVTAKLEISLPMTRGLSYR